MVSLATGSSWSTVATIGIALIGVGQALGINQGVIAGAVISGAYFGDKMSPLSDTTNLAPAMAGTDLFTHIRYMTITTVPAMTLTLIIFLIIGFTYKFEATPGDIDLVLESIESKFRITPWLMLVPSFPDLYYCQENTSLTRPAGRLTYRRRLCHYLPAAADTRGGPGTGWHHHLPVQGFIPLGHAGCLWRYCHYYPQRHGQ